MLKIPAPRLLPATIATLAALLLVKCGVLLGTVVTHGEKPDGVMVGVANAASTERPPEHGATLADHGKPNTNPPPLVDPRAADPKAAASAPPPEGPPPVSESERALLQDLRQRRKELDARTDAITARESVLTATEQKLATRIAELQALQKKLEGLDAAQKQKQDAGWQGLVKVYEAMKPKEAATIFNDLQMPVLLQVFDRMKDAKAASVLAAMNPDKAREVTTALAQMRTGAPAAQLGPDISRGNSTGG
jgi:flagellar motility protein MotE (MotC chaperone)